MTLDGEVMAVNGKLLAGHTNLRAMPDDDQTSVSELQSISLLVKTEERRMLVAYSCIT